MFLHIGQVSDIECFTAEKKKSKNSLVQYCKNVDQIYFDTGFFVWRRVSAWVNDRMDGEKL